MNGKVCIVLLAALVYLTETVLLPSAITMGPQGKSCSAGSSPAAGSCCAAKMKGNTRPCHRKNPAAPRDCNNAANCINCPLCFSATLTSIPDNGTPALLYKMDYPAIPAAPLSAYYSKAWKPPDAGRFSTDRI